MAHIADKYVKYEAIEVCRKVTDIMGKNTINYIAILDTLTDKRNGMAKPFAENNT